MATGKLFVLRLVLVSLLLLSCQSRRNFTQHELEYIGDLIFKNECSRDYKCLTAWNEGEEFASFGIGHFIWYPEGENIVYDESFPRLISFLSKHDIEIPAWIYKNGKVNMPWKDRNEFMNEFDSRIMLELRDFLAATIDYQILFMIDRMEEVLPKILRATDYNRRILVKYQYYRMYHSETGIFCLIDYTNFKGEGIKKTETYNGYGWGLRQVLENMEDNGDDNEISDFIESAEIILARRVLNSPESRNEQKWLPGWINRVNSYKDLNIRQ